MKNNSTESGRSEHSGDADSLFAKSLAGSHGMLVKNRRVRVLSGWLAGLMPQGGRILDIGAGSGELAQSIQTLRPDLSFGGIDTLIRPGTAIHIKPFDGRRIPDGDGVWDSALIVDVLHHCEDPAELFAEAVRVSRKYVIIKDHIAESSWDRSVLRFMDWFGNRGHGVALPYNYLSWELWSKMFESHHCEIDGLIKKLSLYPFPFGLLFDRNLHFIVRLEKK